jgi:hypothetical protein
MPTSAARRLRAPAAVTACLCALAVTAAPSSAAPAATGALTVPRLDRAPVIDGRLAEGEWDASVEFALEHQIQPGDNVAPSEATRVRIGYDTTHLYLAIHAQDSDPGAVRARVGRRDAVYADDYVSIYLDTFDDRRRAYIFYVNPLGIQADGIITGGTVAETAQVADLTWDGLFHSNGRVVEDGYIVEVAIPFRTLRYRAAPTLTWGLHVQRWIARKAESVHWQPISRDRSEFLVQMGTITGMSALGPARVLDVIPTLTGARSETPAGGTTSPPGLARSEQADLGVSATYTLTPGLTVSGTLNPDFSQIEADVPQIDVNQRFALFYPETRPFFLEGGEVFRSAGLRTFVNTRQIIDPDWGVKLTGKVGRQQVGVLAASDRAPGLQVTDTGQPGHRQNALFLIGRVRRDLGESSRAGLFLTRRHWAGTDNTVAAVDGEVRFRDVNTFGYQLAGSRTAGTGTTATGSTSYLWHEHRGRHLRLFTRAYHTSPEFDMQAGFQRRRGIYGAGGNFGWEIQARRDTWWVSVRPFVVPSLIRTWEGGTIDESWVDPGVELRFARNVRVYAYGSWGQDTFAGRTLTHQSAVMDYSIDAFKSVSIGGLLRVGEGPHFDRAAPQVGNRLAYRQTLRLQAGPSLSASLLWQLERLAEKRSGRTLIEQSLTRARLAYQFPRAYSARALVDYDTARQRLGTSVLAAWEPRPNTALYLGYNDLVARDPRERALVPSGRANRTIFFKVGYGYRWTAARAESPGERGDLGGEGPP